MAAPDYFTKITPTGKTFETDPDLKRAQPFTDEGTAKFIANHIKTMNFKTQIFSPKGTFFYIIIQDQ
jgi:hypothetical protein